MRATPPRNHTPARCRAPGCGRLHSRGCSTVVALGVFAPKRQQEWKLPAVMHGGSESNVVLRTGCRTTIASDYPTILTTAVSQAFIPPSPLLYHKPSCVVFVLVRPCLTRDLSLTTPAPILLTVHRIEGISAGRDSFLGRVSALRSRRPGFFPNLNWTKLYSSSTLQAAAAQQSLVRSTSTSFHVFKLQESTRVHSSS